MYVSLKNKNKNKEHLSTHITNLEKLSSHQSYKSYSISTPYYENVNPIANTQTQHKPSSILHCLDNCTSVMFVSGDGSSISLVKSSSSSSLFGFFFVVEPGAAEFLPLYNSDQEKLLHMFSSLFEICG